MFGFFKGHKFIRFSIGLAVGIVLTLLMTLAASCSASAEMIGMVKLVKSEAYGTPPQMAREQKFLRFPVVQDELIETGSSGGVQLEFLDHTTLTLGPDSSIVLETYIYDPNAQSVITVFNVTVGLVRYVSGKIQNANAEIITPTAHIGIRGSDAIIAVEPDGATTLSVISGRFTFSDRDKKDRRTVTASQSVSASSKGVVSTVKKVTITPPKTLDIPVTTVSGAAKIVTTTPTTLHKFGLDTRDHDRDRDDDGHDDRDDHHDDHDDHHDD